MTDFSKGFRELRKFDEIDRFQSDYSDAGEHAPVSSQIKPRFAAWLLAVLGVVGILSAVALVVENHGETLQSVRRVQDRTDLRFLIAALAEIKLLRNSNGSAEKWELLKSRLMVEAERRSDFLQSRLSPDAPQRALLLRALQEYLPAALDHCRQEPCAEEEQIESVIDQEQQLMSVK